MLSILWVYLIYYEFIQRFTQDDYLDSLYNKIDIFQFTMSFIIVYSHVYGSPINDQDTLRIISGYMVILLWIKILEILRVYRIFSFYVKLIIETIKDMSAFIIVFLAILFTFTTATYVNDMTSYE